jgi:hypothetical protein
MPSILLATAAVCIGSLALGQGGLAICGARRWSWLSPAIGVAVMILLVIPALHVPGRSATVAAVTGILVLGGIALWVRRRSQAPRLVELLAALPVAVLVLVPFAAAGHGGTLGVGLDDDMWSHLRYAEDIRSSVVAASGYPLSNSYPIGPHALAAALAEGLGLRTDLAFAGLTAAVPILLAWTALASIPRVRWPGKVLVATVVGIPFLVAAYYGEGSFKELFEALFTLACALILAGFQPDLGWRRWVPYALVCAGAVSVYSLQGLVWPAALLGVWLIVRLGISTWRSGVGRAWRELLAGVPPAALASILFVVVLIPQIPRIKAFEEAGFLEVGGLNPGLGNLVAPLPGWEAFGTWNNPDFRYPAVSAFTAGMWAAFVLSLVILGGILSLRRGRWMLPVAAAVVMSIWAYSAFSGGSPYLAAKALVIATPPLLLLAGLALVEWRTVRLPWWPVAASVLGVALFARVADSSFKALRFSPVGPTTHLVELRSLRPLLGRQPTLFLSTDPYAEFELAEAKVRAAMIGGPPMRPARLEGYGVTLDFEASTAGTLNEFDWVITTRDAAGGEPPPGIQLFRQTKNFDLWRRVGNVPSYEILEEGAAGYQILNCKIAADRALTTRGGIAAVKAPSAEVPVPQIPSGQSTTVKLPLTAGTWELETPYTSPLPVRVTAPGLHVTIPANLDPTAGTRWPIGRIVVARPENIAVTFHVDATWLSPSSDEAEMVALVATPVGTDHTVPLRQACGKPVGWYKPL